MQRITVPLKPINQIALHEQLDDAIGSTYMGFSINRRNLIIFLGNDVTSEERTEATTIIRNHDVTVKSRAEVKQAMRKARLDNTRRNQAPELDLAVYGDEPNTVRELAEKIYWLELEIRTLTGQ